jgi:hypothetical protein
MRESEARGHLEEQRQVGAPKPQQKITHRKKKPEASGHAYPERNPKCVATHEDQALSRSIHSHRAVLRCDRWNEMDGTRSIRSRVGATNN